MLQSDTYNIHGLVVARTCSRQVFPIITEARDGFGVLHSRTEILWRKTTLLTSYAREHSSLYQQCLGSVPLGSYRTNQCWWS
jgi:hypothetical protein